MMSAPATTAKRTGQFFHGIVLSSGLMQKTIKVRITTQPVLHPVVRKVVARQKNVLVHDERELCKQGDVVEVKSCRPMSARKRFEVYQILRKSPSSSSSSISQSVVGARSTKQDTDTV